MWKVLEGDDSLGYLIKLLDLFAKHEKKLYCFNLSAYGQVLLPHGVP